MILSFLFGIELKVYKAAYMEAAFCFFLETNQAKTFLVLS